MRLPKLSGRIAIDLETCDPNLKTRGPGDVRDDGFIAGVAIADASGFAAYYPLRHETGWNVTNDMDDVKFWAWLREELADPNLQIVGANLPYDMGWLKKYGIDVPGRWLDVQIAEPLLDENRYSYALDLLARKYTGRGKPQDDLYAWLSAKLGGAPTRKRQAGSIWRAPSDVVGPYAIGDVLLPLEIIAQQEREIERQGLGAVFDLESRLAKMILAMRRRGVRVDVEKAHIVGATIKRKENEARERLNIDSVWSAAEIGKRLDKLGIEYGRTAKTGAPSITQGWLSNRIAAGCTFSKDLLDIRQAEKARTTFVDGYVLEHAANGRIHAQFHQLRTGENGAVTGRLSSSNPNLQNVPSRDPVMAPLIRGMFVPEDGEEWVSHDFSQIEYRQLAHYGSGQAARRVRMAYADNPDMDFHQATADDMGIERKPAKNINFGMIYGMGKKKLADSLGLSLEDAKEVLELFHGKQPFARGFAKEAMRRAQKRGFVHTIMGRRRRFETWEPRDWDLSGEVQPTSDIEALTARIEEAQHDYDNGLRDKAPGKGTKRAQCHKAANSIIQGGAADLMKKAMVDIWESGVCDELGAPLLTVHDELDWSRPRTAAGNEAVHEARRLMENVWPALRVPMRVDEERGDNWGELRAVERRD